MSKKMSSSGLDQYYKKQITTKKTCQARVLTSLLDSPLAMTEVKNNTRMGLVLFLFRGLGNFRVG